LIRRKSTPPSWEKRTISATCSADHDLCARRRLCSWILVDTFSRKSQIVLSLNYSDVVSSHAYKAEQKTGGVLHSETSLFHHSEAQSLLAFALVHHHIHVPSVVFLKPTVSSRPSIPTSCSDSAFNNIAHYKCFYLLTHLTYKTQKQHEKLGNLHCIITIRCRMSYVSIKYLSWLFGLFWAICDILLSSQKSTGP